MFLRLNSDATILKKTGPIRIEFASNGNMVYIHLNKTSIIKVKEGEK